MRRNALSSRYISAECLQWNDVHFRRWKWGILPHLNSKMLETRCHLWKKYVSHSVFDTLAQQCSVVRLRRLETHTWLWVDCRRLTEDATSLRSAVWLCNFNVRTERPMKQDNPLQHYPSQSSAVWLFNFLTKCRASQFVIVLTRRLNYASEFTVDLVQQVREIGSFTVSI